MLKDIKNLLQVFCCSAAILYRLATPVCDLAHALFMDCYIISEHIQNMTTRCWSCCIPPT